MRKNVLLLVTAAGLAAGSVTACSNAGASAVTTAAATTAAEKKEYSNAEDGGHAILEDGTTAEYNNITVSKTGDSEGDEADFYGENAAVLAQNGATLKITNADIHTDGTHANGVFSYGEGTTVDISDSTINTSSNCSGGIMTTGGGTMKASNLTVTTQGRSSAAIRSDRGGGTVTVNGGTYETNGMGSPAIYSTADITVKDAKLKSNTSQGVVVEGKNSVTLENVDMTSNHTQKNSDKSDQYQAVMLYQSMSGDADEGAASFTMSGGSITNKNGGMFYVNNTVAEISLTDVALTYAADDFLRVEKAGWGNEGSNGGQVTFKAVNQKMEGLTTVDDISTLNLYLSDGSVYNGAINTNGAAGGVYVEIDDASTWTLSADSYISSLTCDVDAIDLNGHKLYINGKEYTEGTASAGTAVEAYKGTSAASDNGNGKMDGKPGEKPNGAQKGNKNGSSKKSDGQTPPSRQDGNENGSSKKFDGQTPPSRPDGDSTGAAPKFDGQTPPSKPDGTGKGDRGPDGAKPAAESTAAN
ncbi:hypothetical protein [[Clostridium] aminophilum]|uniref:hypothetical protein n=1 Tax=[Clostridium] aminophilum TaxID=1526 RepID=UPI00331F7556